MIQETQKVKSLLPSLLSTVFQSPEVTTVTGLVVDFQTPGATCKHTRAHRSFAPDQRASNSTYLLGNFNLGAPISSFLMITQSL